MLGRLEYSFHYANFELTLSKYLNMNKGVVIIICLIFCFFSCKTDDETHKGDQGFEHVELFSGLVNPWGLAELNDGSWLITERVGRLNRWKDGQLLNISGLPSTIKSIGQGGLMDVLIYKESGNAATIFFTATNAVGSLHSTAVFSAILNLEKNHLENVKNLYQATPLYENGGHFGSRIVITKNQFLFLGLGERQQQNWAQDNSNSSGCVVRLNLNGSIPPSNPFTQVDSIADEIWTFGHRNIQGMDIHPETKELWTHEHGPKGGDEINIIKKAKNYGWPLATYGINYDGTVVSDSTHIQGTEQPIYFWTPSIAPCGLEIYSGSVFPQWKHHIFVGALAKQHINRLSLKGGEVMEEERMFPSFGRFRAIKEGKDGFIYLLSEGNGGKFTRIQKK